MRQKIEQSNYLYNKFQDQFIDGISTLTSAADL